MKIETGRGVTTLTLPNLYKDDEGLYTLRMVTKGGTAEHSAFVSVSGEATWLHMAMLPCCHPCRDVVISNTITVITLLFAVDGPPPVPNAPGAPMDIKIHDANRDYVIVSWKPPNTTTEGPILGYFVDK